MPTEIARQALSTPLTLLVRCVSSESQTWAAWGGHHAVPGVWRFTVPNKPTLLELLERLSASLPSAAQADTLAAVCAACEPADVIPLGLLTEFQSLPVLLTRWRYPWLTGNLMQHVRSYLQPIVDLSQGGQVFAYEALCRGVTPEGALLTGQQMFTLAARANCLDALDATCQHSALLAKAKFLSGNKPLFINILPCNLLTLDLQQEPWVHLPAWGIRPEELVFEIVESEQIENMDALVETTDRLRNKGFRIALDDVGSGYNGLTVLATLRPDYLKLDRGLVQGVQSSRVRLVLLQALISMAQRLGCATIAEGLERLEDIAVCRDMGIHFAQGYYFAPPAPEPSVPHPLPPRQEVPRPLRTNTVRLRDFVEPIPTLALETTTDQVQEYLRQYPHQPTVILLDDHKPVGYLSRHSARSLPPGNTGLGRYCKLLDKILHEQMPARILAYRLYHDPDPAQPWVVVDYRGDYLGILEPWSVLTQLFSGHPREGVNPLSRLPTGPILRQTLDLQLQMQKAVVLVYIDLDHFKAFNDRYGFVRGDAMIMLLAEVLQQTFRSVPETYLGHIGGDDFIAIVPSDTPELQGALKTLLTSFCGLAAYLYDSDDLRRGFFVTEDGNPHPTAAISVAIINGRSGSIADSLAAGTRAAQLKKLAKAQLGSVIVIEDTPPRFLSVASAMSQENRWEERARQSLLDIARQPRGKNHHDLDEHFKLHPFFELIYELDTTGVQRYPNWVHPGMRGRLKGGGVGVDRSDQPYFQVVAHSHAPYVSSIYLSSASGEFCATVAVPLHDPDAAFHGVLVGDLNLTGLVALSAALQDRMSASIGEFRP